MTDNQYPSPRSKLQAEAARIEERVQETERSIALGARRSNHRFSLTAPAPEQQVDSGTSLDRRPDESEADHIARLLKACGAPPPQSRRLSLDRS